tara:strand:+ start:15 stop:1307 length:1293 start_codon:yes stop_codon:yes gene_type:complete
MATDTIGTNALASNAVTSAKITDGAINNAKVASNAGIVTTKISGLDTTIDNGLGRLENEIGLLNVNRLIDNGAALDDFVKGFSDAFTNEAGVNTSANSNATYSASNDTYSSAENVVFAWNSITESSDASTWAGDTSRWTWGSGDGNNFGSSGNFGGNVRTGVYWNNTESGTGDIVRIQLADTTNSGVLFVYEATAQSHIGTTGNTYFLGIGSSSSSHWPNGSPTGVNAIGLSFHNSGGLRAYNPGTDGTAISGGYSASDVFVINRNASSGAITVSKNGSAVSAINSYLTKSIGADWRIAVGHAAEGASLNFDNIEIGGSAGDGTFLASTFQTAAQTATLAPSTVRLVLLGKEEQSQTINTDTVWSISRNGGTTFSAITMTQSGNYNSSGVKIYTGTLDVSGQPSGTSVVLKQTTTVNKRFTMHGYSLLYK